MISIKDYAKESGVTYEAVRQQVKRYQAELEGHIHIQGRTQYLDDIAVAILNSHRSVNPVVVYDKGAGEDFRALQQELAEARAETKDFWEQLKKKDETMALLVQQNEQYRLQAASVARLEADNEAAKLRAAEAEERAKQLQTGMEEKTEAYERILRKKNERIQALEKYAAERAEFDALPWIKKIGRKAPVAPDLQEDTE